MQRVLRHRVGGGNGLVTVVVTAGSDDLPGLDACLERLRAQSYLLSEVVVATHGPAPEAVALRHAAGDWRVRVVRSPAAGWAEAANAGAGAARGRYLMFVRGSDRLPAQALSSLVSSLSGSGSDLAVGRLGQVGHLDEYVDAAQRAAHSSVFRGVRLDSAPDAVADLHVGNRMYRTEFWRGLGLLFGADEDWQASSTSLCALLRAERVDVLPVDTYELVHTGLVYGATPDALPSMPARLAHATLVLETLSAEGTGSLVSAWLGHLLDRELVRLLDDTERADAAQWDQMCAAVRRFSDRAGPAVWDRVRAASRTKLWLAGEGRRELLEDFVASRWFEGDQLRTVVADGKVLAVWPGLDDRVAVPDGHRSLPPGETRAVVSLRGARWSGGRLLLDLYVFVRKVDMSATMVSITAELVAGQDTHRPLSVAARSEPAVNRFARDRYQDYAPGAIRVEVDPAGLADHPQWQLRVRCAVGGVTRESAVTHIDRQGSVALLGARHLPQGDLRVELSADAGLRLVPLAKGRPVDAPREPDPAFHVSGVELRGETLRVRGTWSDPAPSSWAVELESDRGRVVARGRSAEGRHEAELELAWREFGGVRTGLPAGRYRLRVRDTGKPGPVPVRVHRDLLPALDADQLSPSYRLRLRMHGNLLGVVLAAPLHDDELGPLAQQRLREWYADHTAPLDEESVYVQSYTGESVTDSPGAMLPELLRRRPALRVRAAVADASCAVPEGARAVLLNSREWYRVLAESKTVVTNLEVERWFTRRPGQVVVQTFHGYPSKAMGMGLWRAKQFSPRRVAAERSRTVEKWSVILTPTPEMDRHYREQYAYEGPILSLGYPRNDGLLAPDADAIRTDVRHRLGIAPHQTAVLYAPTWRDDLATAPRAAATAAHLDVAAAAAALGEGFVLLLRGHRFHTPGAVASAAGAGVVEVSAYPEINDLVLASDVALVDYTSLRFDYAVTGKPMLFLVPDLDRYSSGVRGFLFDFADTAPGALLATTAEVVDALRDLAGVTERHAEHYRRFNATYNYRHDGQVTGRVVAALLVGYLSTE